MMFETSTLQLSTFVRCNRCGATLEISTDDRRMAARSSAAFRESHRCQLHSRMNHGRQGQDHKQR